MFFSKNHLKAFDGNGSDINLSNERIEIEILTGSIKGDMKRILQFAAIPGALAAAIPGLVSLGMGVGKFALKRVTSSFLASTEAEVSGSGFYSSEGVLLPGLLIRKYIQEDKGKEELAYLFTLKPELSPDKTFYRYVLDKYLLKYSGARTTSVHNKLKFQFEITLEGRHIKPDGNYESKTIGKTIINSGILKFTDLEIAPPHLKRSGWLPLVPPLIESSMEQSKVKRKLDAHEGTLYHEESKKETEWTKSGLKTTNIKKTIMQEKDMEGNPIWTESEERTVDTNSIVMGSGNYSIKINVKEANPFKLRMDELNEFFTDNEEAITEILQSVYKEKG